MEFNTEPEVRCGYKVSSKLKKIWNVEINLLLEIIRVCDKYNLRFTLWAGTMLGAIRHKGFIPWDDDLDIALPREDYEKFLKVADTEFKSPYFLQTALTDNKFFFGYARLRNSETTGMITWNKSADYNNGIYVDIYVLDGYDANKRKVKLQLIKRDIVKQLLNVYYADKTYKSRKPGIIVKYCIGIHRKCKKYVNIISKYNSTAGRLGMMTHEVKDIKKYWCKYTDFNDIVMLTFEGIKVPVLKNYDVILKNFYGNYMEFPPVELRGAWHEDLIIFNPDISYKEYLDIGGNSNETKGH